MKRKTPPNIQFPGYNEFPLPAAGTPLAATWLFTNSTEETWVHEVGHHRHLGHAASAPLDGRAAFRTKLHDAEDNMHAVWPAGTGAPDKGWDRCCIMSYTSESERLYFCGKCILRMRGWKVEGLGQPGGNRHDS